MSWLYSLQKQRSLGFPPHNGIPYHDFISVVWPVICCDFAWMVHLSLGIEFRDLAMRWFDPKKVHLIWTNDSAGQFRTAPCWYPLGSVLFDDFTRLISIIWVDKVWYIFLDKVWDIHRPQKVYSHLFQWELHGKHHIGDATYRQLNVVGCWNCYQKKTVLITT